MLCNLLHCLFLLLQIVLLTSCAGPLEVIDPEPYVRQAALLEVDKESTVVIAPIGARQVRGTDIVDIVIEGTWEQSEWIATYMRAAIWYQPKDWVEIESRTIDPPQHEIPIAINWPKTTGPQFPVSGERIRILQSISLPSDAVVPGDQIRLRLKHKSFPNMPFTPQDLIMDTQWHAFEVRHAQLDLPGWKENKED